jgi:hypothetical protein
VRKDRYVRWLNLLAVPGIVGALTGLAFPRAGEWAAHLLNRTAITSSGLAHPQASPAAHHIKHIVFILEENRSFDNVFGRFPGADGATQATVAIGGHAMTIPLVPEPYYLWHDLGHDLHDAQLAVNHGKMDGFSHETYSLDHQLQHVLSQELNLSPSQLAALHRTSTLLQIARLHHVKSSALASALKTVAGAGAGGEVLLQLIKLQDAGRETYLAMRRIDQLLQATPGTPLFR